MTVVTWAARRNRLQYFPGLSAPNRKSQIDSDVICHSLIHIKFLQLDTIGKPKPLIQNRPRYGIYLPWNHGLNSNAKWQYIKGYHRMFRKKRYHLRSLMLRGSRFHSSKSTAIKSSDPEHRVPGSNRKCYKRKKTPKSPNIPSITTQTKAENLPPSPPLINKWISLKAGTAHAPGWLRMVDCMVVTMRPDRRTDSLR